MTRKKPGVKCSNCGRTVAFKNKAAAYLTASYALREVNPGNLRAHKCSHGRYCDECKEKHQ